MGAISSQPNCQLPSCWGTDWITRTSSSRAAPPVRPRTWSRSDVPASTDTEARRPRPPGATFFGPTATSVISMSALGRPGVTSEDA